MDVKDSLTKSYLAGAYEFRSQEDKVRQLSAIYHSPRRVAQLLYTCNLAQQFIRWLNFH